MEQPIISILKGIKDYMQLNDNQVMLFNQNYNVPHNKELFIVGQVLDSNIEGNETTKIDYATNQVYDVLRIKETIQIDIVSHSLEAMDRKEEVIFALKNIDNNFISFIDVANQKMVAINETEGADIPYRYAITFSIWYDKRSKIREGDYMGTRGNVFIKKED